MRISWLTGWEGQRDKRILIAWQALLRVYDLDSFFNCERIHQIFRFYKWAILVSSQPLLPSVKYSPDLTAVVSWLVFCLQCVLHHADNFLLPKIQFDPITYLPNTQMSLLSPPCSPGAHSAWFLASQNLASFSPSLFSFMDAAFPLRWSVRQASQLSTLKDLSALYP